MIKQGVWELGVVVSALLNELRAEQDAFAEAHEYGAMPDVAELIVQGTDQRLVQLFARSGWSPAEVVEAVALVCNDKVVWNMGLGAIEDRVALANLRQERASDIEC